MLRQREYDFLYKIILVGDAEVGKSCILQRYVDAEFQSAYINTIGVEFKVKKLEVEGKVVKLQVWDAADHDTKAYSGALGAVCVFNAHDISSWRSAMSFWLAELADNINARCCVALVANKTDLATKVNLSEAKAIAEDLGLLYKEVSAKENRGVEELFSELVEWITKRDLTEKITEFARISATLSTELEVIRKQREAELKGKEKVESESDDDANLLSPKSKKEPNGTLPEKSEREIQLENEKDAVDARIQLYELYTTKPRMIQNPVHLTHLPDDMEEIDLQLNNEKVVSTYCTWAPCTVS